MRRRIDGRTEALSMSRRSVRDFPDSGTGAAGTDWVSEGDRL